MTTQRVALLVGVLFTGLFAGLMFTFSVVIERVMKTLSASEYTEVMQGLIRGADIPPIVPAVVIIAWVAPLVALWQMRHDRADPAFRLTLIGWIVFTAGVFVFTVAFNLPINKQILSPETVRQAAYGLMTPDQLESFKRELEIDFAISEPGLGRFRVNVFYQRGYPAMVLRYISADMPKLDALGLPDMFKDLIMMKRGLILMVGATGSGKSTSIAAMINHRNETASDHIVTIEDPIEFLHTNKRSIVNQREVGLDTESYMEALRRVLRQDPDVILIGELRDEESAQAALQAAESGHFVLSTMHTIDAAETIGRLVEFFPPGKQQMTRQIIAGVLRGVVSQRLLPKKGGGRVAAVEVMVNTARIAELIRDGETDKITEAIEDGDFHKMQSFSQHLVQLVLAGLVEEEVAANAASNRHDFEMAVQQALKRRRADEKAAAEAEAAAEPEAEEAEAEEPEPVQSGNGAGIRVASTET